MTLTGMFSATQVVAALDELGADPEWRERFEDHLAKVRTADGERLIVDPEERAAVVTLREVADRLEKPYHTVMRWAERRPTSGFPNPIGRTLSTGRGRHAHAFDREEVRDWLSTKRGLVL